MALNRVSQLAGHLIGSPRSKLLSQNDDDVVITMAVRSPLTKAWKGQMKDVKADQLMYAMFKATIPRMGIHPALVEDITVGTVITPGGGAYEVRGAALAAGFPETVPTKVLNRWCSSGLMAVADIASQIKAGSIEIGLAAGLESMSANRDGGSPKLSEELMAHPVAKDIVEPMGWTSENIVKDFNNVTRAKMDKVAAESYNRAERAQKEGHFDKEIVPLSFNVPDAQNPGQKKTITVAKDDGIRYGTTAESLGKIRAAFPQYGVNATTGGNASQITDGAACVLLMTRRKAKQLGVPILAKYVLTVTSGLAPRIMGIGPTYAIPRLFGKLNITKDDVDLFEVNEAFATMYVYTLEKLGLDPKKVNVNGGAIALGHPLGTTGARQIATILNEARRSKDKILVTSMCIGTGMGAACLLVNEQA